jgi:glycosyltransferase involved in cell wall biosynthesis
MVGLARAIVLFGTLGKRLRAWERATGVKIDLVFFACIYDAHFERLRYAERFFRFPWSGLYLHARSFRMPGSPIPYFGGLPCPEKIFTLKSLRSVAVLDEKAVTPLRQITGGKAVVAFPETTDARLPAKSDPARGLANKILEFARGRPVVSLVGHLQRTKGLEEFTRAAQDESLRDMVFALAGEVSWKDINNASRDAILRAWEQLPNVFTYLQRITDERALNAAMASSDIIFAAYTDFPNSSGILTKAAVFERPVIVSDGYLMAERARAYHLGEVVKERDTEAIKAALRRLGGLDPAAERFQGGRWKEYREAHSYERLAGAFAELLGIPAEAVQSSSKTLLAGRPQVEV